MSAEWPVLTALLVHIQTHLEDDLTLEALAARAGYSPHHLQRLFKAAIGETPKAYCERLRLERAAFRLNLHEVKLIDLALDCGYAVPETFGRAFQRRYGMPPAAYRDWVRRRDADAPADAPRSAEAPGPSFDISATQVRTLAPVPVAFIRHLGPYEDVPESLFDELSSWADRQRLGEPRVWMGIGHDAPGVTPPEHLRFDAALVVPRPLAPEGRIGFQQLPGGEHAITTHAGPYASLPNAYAAIFPRVMSLPGYRFVGLPAIEVYHTAKVNVGYHLNHTDICLPVAHG
ncbi:MAG: GyrI-like domain-containing protein [Betaproteobacteria bacterium]|nr:GyrI-like domain-containing protein [Betaproteobacteria bacterium]